MNKFFEELFQNVNVIQNVALPFPIKICPVEIFTRATPGSSLVFYKQIIYLYLWALKNNCGAEFFLKAMFGYLRVLLYCVPLGQCVTHNINCRLYGNDLCHKKLPLFKRMYIFHLLRWLHQPIFHVQIKIRGHLCSMRASKSFKPNTLSRHTSFNEVADIDLGKYLPLQKKSKNI